jgi:hypothetical protein
LGTSTVVMAASFDEWCGKFDFLNLHNCIPSCPFCKHTAKEKGKIDE